MQERDPTRTGAVNIVFRTNAEMLAGLQKAAEADDRSVSGVIRHALRLYLEGKLADDGK